MVFGDDASEHSHGLQANGSDIQRGELDQPLRRLLPHGAGDWQGGTLAFSMKVDPERQCYLTIRCSGDEVNENYLVLFCEGKQVGYRHLGDIDVLSLPDEAPRYNGRFYYVTTPLPFSLTKGRQEVPLEIRSTGPIWGYGSTWEQYQKPMTKPSRGIYGLYTHDEGCFIPPVDEKQGEAPAATIRSEPGPEVMDQLKERVNKTIDGLLKSSRPINQMQIQFLARAYFVQWTPAFQSQRALDQVVKGVDELQRRWKESADELWHDKATWNPGWFGVGPAADAVRRLAQQLQPSLDEPSGGETRRAAWSAMFQASRDWLRSNRRWLANQAMFTDTNLYLSDQGVAAIDPRSALPHEKAIDYLYQSVGLKPWLGLDTPNGPEKPFGGSFYEVTEKGLTRERGFVGGYGEGGLEGAMDIYNATRVNDRDGDPRIKAQLAKMLRARGPFRYPMLDDDGHRAMRLETAVGWRDTHMPGDITYAQRNGGEHSPLETTAATLDPEAIGYVQQMFADNQFFASVSESVKSNRFRDITGLLELPGEYELLKAQPPSAHSLPMSWDQPDFVFSDEQDGVVAIKNGNEMLFASLYWRAGHAINFLARTHYLTANYQQEAVVHEDVQYTTSNRVYRRPDWINFGFGNGGTNIKYPPDIHQALAGEELPIALGPPDVKTKSGEESYDAGKGDFYSLRFGRYLIAMNMTQDRTFEIKAPSTTEAIEELASKRREVPSGAIERVAPQSTVVFYVHGD